MMRILPFLTLFALPASCVPFESSTQAKHPSIDLLNKFCDQVTYVTENITKWDGNPNYVSGIFDSAREAISTLQNATTQLNDGGDIDWWSSSFGFAAAGLTVSSRAHSFSTAITSKLGQFKAVGADQAIFQVLDSAYTEATAFFTASKAKTPAFVYSLISPFRNEILGTVADAREQFRPRQEVVVVVVPGKDGGSSLYTFTGGIPSSFPTQVYQPQNTYQPQSTYQAQNPNQTPFQPAQPQYTLGTQYTQYIPGAPQYAPPPSPAQYTQYKPTASGKSGYSW